MSEKTETIPIDEEPCIVDFDSRYFEEEDEDEVTMMMLPKHSEKSKEGGKEKKEEKVEKNTKKEKTYTRSRAKRPLTPPVTNKFGIFGVYVVLIDGEADCCLDSLEETEKYIRNKAREIKAKSYADPYYTLHLIYRPCGIDIERTCHCFLVSYDTVIHKLRYIFVPRKSSLKALSNV